MQGPDVPMRQPPESRNRLEMRLTDLAYKTERGCKLTNSDRVEMEEVVVQLEAIAQSQPAQV